MIVSILKPSDMINSVESFFTSTGKMFKNHCENINIII